MADDPATTRCIWADFAGYANMGGLADIYRNWKRQFWLVFYLLVFYFDSISFLFLLDSCCGFCDTVQLD